MYSLVGFQLCNFTLSLYNLILTGGIISIIGIIISAALLYLIYTRDEYLVLCTRFWASLVIIAGSSGLVASGCAYINTVAGGNEFEPESYSISTYIYNFLLITFGLYYWIYSKQYFVIKPETVHQTTE
jgi:hypothetical protein